MIDMQAGRELNAEIARRVFGAKTAVGPNDDYIWIVWGGISGVIPPSPYSTDVGAAWTIVEHFEADGGEWSMGMFRDTKTYEFILYRKGHSVFGRAESVPLAICRAALKAVGEEGETA